MSGLRTLVDSLVGETFDDSFVAELAEGLMVDEALDFVSAASFSSI